jgi:hypothetical protein
VNGQPPPIDPRDRQDIIEQTTALATRYSGWQPRADGRPDAGQALIGIFARFAELVIQRVNQAPERNYLAFLNLIGTRPVPPVPARVPLTFSLAERSPADAVVPAGTQVAAAPLDGQDDEVVFETETPLVVTRAQLRSVLVGDAANDRYADRTDQQGEPFDVFVGDQRVPHQLFIACDPVLTRPGRKDVTLVLTAEGAELLNSWPISWWYWDGAGWQPVNTAETVQGDVWRVTLPGLPQLPSYEVNGISAGWVRAQLDMGLPPGQAEPPTITGIGVRSDTPPEPVTAPAAFANNSPLDLSKAFYPLGEQPRFNDTFFLACPDSLARPGATLALTVTLTNVETGGPLPPVRTDGKPKIAWETWNGTSWLAVTALSLDGKEYAFTTNATVQITLPDGLARTEVNGTEQYWLRVRLIGGNYGLAAGYREKPDGYYTRNPDGTFTKNPGGAYELLAATFAPPVIAKLSWTLGQGPAVIPASAWVTSNNFRFLTHGWDIDGAIRTFQPFTRSTDRDPALYLGFDKPFDTRPVTLYLQVEPPAPEEVTADRLVEPDLADRADLVWEYSGPDGWQPLAAVDETETLAGRGVVQFAGPADLVARECFGRTWCWLRLRWRRGMFPVPPRLRGVRPNTIWATQAATVSDEILGSGTAEPGQSFVTAQTPVLAGHQVVVREDTEEDTEESWVAWQAVTDFTLSGPLDRHYTVDPRTGEIGFGDGQAGHLVPRGQNNVRITYRTGGGVAGNRAEGTVVTLKSAVPYVDSVTNFERSQGGAPWEPIERLRVRGPKALRHRDRAVTAEDLEDIAFEASAGVARARAVVPSRFDPTDLWLKPAEKPRAGHTDADAGQVGVIVVPDSAEPRPAPSLGLVRQVQDYLRARGCATTDLWVAGPEWVRVTVTATVVPSTPGVAELSRGRVKAALDRYLHPLTGGPEGTGWAFGRKPHRSDLFAVAEAVEGVDHVLSLDVAQVAESDDLGDRLAALLSRSLADPATQPPAPELTRWLSRALVYSGPHVITVTLRG